jgi:LAO/AO transport system kinase
MQGNVNIETLFAALRQGERAALGRAITLVESTREQDRNTAQELIERCLPHAGNSLRLGITGVPGVGKSTLIDALGMAMIETGNRVAVLAVDPSSSRSSGSILGDKTRMERLGTQDAAFIRPSPTSGVLGGVARCTRETIILCEAAGYDRLLVETVGVGQSELEVDRMTDLNLLLMLTGAGDELQGIKRGIMESADLIALTKAEGDNLTRAEAARRDLRNAVMYLPMRDGVRHPEVLLTSAVQGTGIHELLAAIEKLRTADAESGRTIARRKEQGLFWMHHALNTGIQERMRNDARINAALPAMETAVQSGTMSPFKAAQELLALFLDR